MEILYLITARRGAKGIAGKNIQKIGGIPLVGFKALSANRSKYSGDIIVSTDSQEIGEIAMSYGAQMPFLRPAELAQDRSSSMDVIAHALEWIKQNWGKEYDYVSLMEPSSPFATYLDLDRAFKSVIESDADSILSVSSVKIAPFFINPFDSNGRMSIFYDQIKGLTEVRRQDFVPYYTLNGAIYIFKTDYFLRTKKIISENTVPYIMDLYHGLEIDEPFDLELAQMFIEKGKIDLSYWE